MVDEVRQSLNSVLAQTDGWQKSLKHIVQSSRESGPDRLEVIDQFLSLEGSGPGLSYLAMAHATWMAHSEQATSALNSWNRAARNRADMLDAEAMAIYERNKRFLDLTHLEEPERKLMQRLIDTRGMEQLLV